MDVKDIPASKEVVDHLLEHHGVLGMKWGVRRASRSGGGSSGGSKSKNSREVRVETGTSPRGHATIKTHGGHKVPAHPDAIAAKTVEQQLRKSGHNSLSNEQMLRYANRKELEARVTRVAPPSDAVRFKRGARQAMVFLRSPEGKATVGLVKKTARSKAAKKFLAKGLATAAIAM